MRIKEACKASGLTQKALAYYEAKGLIQPALMSNGYRDYPPEIIPRLKQIAVMRGLSLPVEEIRRLLCGELTLAAVARSRALALAEDKARLKILTELTGSGDWAQAQSSLAALARAQSVCQRLADSFPGFFGQYLALHFAPYLAEPIQTQDQQEAFDTLVAFLDGVDFTLPTDLQPFMESLSREIDLGLLEKMSDAIAEAVKAPADYLETHGDELHAYLDLQRSDAFKSSPASRLRQHLETFCRQEGYQDIFIPAMRRLSPAYDAYQQALRAADRVFLKHLQQP